MATISARGVRKVNERILQEGRALFLTEEDADKLSWSDIPVGSHKVNPKTGVLSVKLEGESDWVPSGIKNDGTITIAKDAVWKEEVFTVTSLDDKTGNFTYTNSNGETRHMPKTKDGYTFEVEEGEYQPGRNLLEIKINDVLSRNAASGGIIEVSSLRFIVQDELWVGAEITAKYAMVIRIGNPYPRIFMTADEPTTADVGDIWLDPEGSLDDDYIETDENGQAKSIDWSLITGTPTSLSGYHIKDAVSYDGHTHTVSDITNFPTSFKAKGGNADTVANKSVGNLPGNIPAIESNGKLNSNIIPSVALQPLTLKGSSGSSQSYNGQYAVTMTLTGQALGIFDSAGRLCFPNGTKLWIV